MRSGQEQYRLDLDDRWLYGPGMIAHHQGAKSFRLQVPEVVLRFSLTASSSIVFEPGFSSTSSLIEGRFGKSGP